jgi:hypothetical protein
VVVDGPLLRRRRPGSASSTFPISMPRSPLSGSGRRCSISALQWRSGRSWTTAALCERRARLLSSAALGGGYSLSRHRPPVSRSDCCPAPRRKGSSLRCGHGAVTDNRPILAAGRSRLGIGSLERPIDRLKQELAASQSRFAKQQRRLGTTLGSPRGQLVRSNRPRRLQAATRLRRWFPTPALPTLSSAMTILAVVGISLPRFALSLAGTRHQQ